MIRTGITNEISMTVTDGYTAAAMGSGTLPVFATPAMILLMEKTACESVAGELKEGESTVGTSMDVKHTAPSLVGSTVTCVSELVEVDRSRLRFSVAVSCCGVPVGHGFHERFIVNNDKFMNSARSRAKD